jgi:hypothetical protein
MFLANKGSRMSSELIREPNISGSSLFDIGIVFLGTAAVANR